MPNVLDRLVEAVGALRNKLGKRAEVIVSGYGESSSRIVYAEEFDARVVSRNLPTLSAAVNAGAATARGSLLVLLDPHLTPREECLCHICEALRDADTLGGGTAVSVKSRGLASTLAAFVTRIPLRLHGLSLGVYFVRKSAFDGLGGFSESTLSSETLEFALRLKRHAADTGKRLANIKMVCATAPGSSYARLSAKEWCMLLFVPLLRRRWFAARPYRTHWGWPPGAGNGTRATAGATSLSGR
ncbi:MAG: glycosyltransferase [Candidatus Eisenbacteria bacterium]|nr:glycosyltransferase [Candidatus Eisenbacteria bacterium]